MDTSDVAAYLCAVSESYGYEVQRGHEAVAGANCASLRSQMAFLGGDPANPDFLLGLAHGLMIAFNSIMQNDQVPGISIMAVVADVVSQIAEGSDLPTEGLGDVDSWLDTILTPPTVERKGTEYRMTSNPAWKPQPWQNQRGRAT